jgi:GH3 auxin-responsive promoter
VGIVGRIGYKSGMVPRLAILAVGKIVGFPSRVKLWTFNAACRRPRDAQETLLQSILAYHAETAFGRDHHFGDIRAVADFRRRVPVAPYEYFEPYLARVRRGETNALLADPAVMMFALTSGTTAARKTIPITPRYLADFRRGWNRWGLRALLDHQRISCSPILQLAGDPEEFHTEAGIPCGSLSGLTVRAQKRLIRFLYCMPAAASPIKDAAVKYYVALRLSLGRPVGMILAANPSTLAALARTLNEEKESLLRDLRDGTLTDKLPIPAAIRADLAPYLQKYPRRARQLDVIAERKGELWPRDVWPPDRMLLGTWTGGSVGPYLRQVARSYGETFVRDLGLVASEGRMTIPLRDGTPAGVLDVTTHYFEFIPEGEGDSPTPTLLGAHELEEGKHYFILLTTAAGLYRYHIHDLVRVAGFHGRTPLLEFLGKGQNFGNLTGEKLSEYQVTQAVADVTRGRGLSMPVYVLAPCWDEHQPYYGLFVERGAWDESDARSALSEIDAALGGANDEYRAKRASGRLGPVRARWLPPGTWAKWDAERLARSGGPPEQYKHPCLIGDVKFRETMQVL